VTLIEAVNILADVYKNDVKAKIVGGFRPGDMRHCLGNHEEISTFLGRPLLKFAEGAQVVFGASEEN